MLMKNALPTPSFLVDLDKLEQNIREMGELCKANGKELWPMVKTHKSSQIAKMQGQAGAQGYLVGTIDEAEMLVEQGFKELMFAYPVTASENIARVRELAKKAHVIVSFDGVEGAKLCNEMFALADLKVDYLITIDCGLHRLGVQPEKAAVLAQELKKLSHLQLKGIASHPGHVYGASNLDEVKKVAAEEIKALGVAKEVLVKEGFAVEIIATGSTPTAPLAAQDKNITALRPGNYVFYDVLQMAMGVVPEERCSLTVLATVISHTREDLYIMDAGSKCFGLDKGAHGISLAQGFGMVKGHPELIVEGLSEEVGKLKVTGPTSLKVGDKVEVIPNHACSSANMTNYLLGCRNDVVEEVIYVDARGGSYRKPPVL